MAIPEPRAIQYQGFVIDVLPLCSSLLTFASEHTAIVIMASTASTVAVAMEVIAALGEYSAGSRLASSAELFDRLVL